MQAAFRFGDHSVPPSPGAFQTEDFESVDVIVLGLGSIDESQAASLTLTAVDGMALEVTPDSELVSTMLGNQSPAMTVHVEF